uniref:Ig-like domain-containing protein n=1 Tax=Myripristis murdjan TaxID=586833 RepID=A0A667XTC9_9TELE
MSRSDSSSSRRLVYGPIKGKAEDSVGRDEPQFPDLSAFLSQEELDKSVNLARQAIGHEPREERAEVKAPVTPSAALSATPSNVPSPTSFNTSSAPSFTLPSTTTCTQPAPEIKELPPTHATFSADTKMYKAPTPQDSMMRNNRASSEGSNDFSRSARHTPYGLETQSKKEFLNKAADFIEELSSLFKANSSKRIRPRACKAHRSRTQNKSQNDGTVYPLGPDERERPVMPLELETESSSPTDGYQGEEAESSAPTETPYSAEPVCEPPRFIQKLKSREVPEGSKVQLDCIVRGLPVPEVRLSTGRCKND